MVTCEFVIKVADGNLWKLSKRKFQFENVPRIGETIWIGDSIGFKVEDVQYGFMDDGPPEIRIESDGKSKEWYMDYEWMLINWDFSKITDFEGSSPRVSI